MGTQQHTKFKRWWVGVLPVHRGCLTPGFPEGPGHHKTGYRGNFLLGGFDEAEQCGTRDHPSHGVSLASFRAT